MLLGFYVIGDATERVEAPFYIDHNCIVLVPLLPSSCFCVFG